MTTERLSRYLNSLRINAGQPTIRELAKETGYGKTTVSDALTGRAIPTWDVTRALIKALGGDEGEAQTRWRAAKGANSTATEQTPVWLISVRDSVPKLITGRGLVAASALAQDDPSAAVHDGWEAIRVSTLHLSAKYYDDVPGSWSSNVVDTIQRARNDGHLPAGVEEQAKLLHRIYIASMMLDSEDEISTLTALQYVHLAYRLAWLVWETAHASDDTDG